MPTPPQALVKTEPEALVKTEPQALVKTEPSGDTVKTESNNDMPVPSIDTAGGADSKRPASPSSAIINSAENGEIVAAKPEVRRVKRQRGARDIESYRIIGPVGEGAYGKVWKAIDPSTNETVALKMIKTGADCAGADAESGFPLTSVREIRILKSTVHPNIVNLKEVITDMEGKVEGGKPRGVYMVFEYLEADLEGLLKTPDIKLTNQHIKTYMKQLLEGLAYMHRNKIMHRDLKGANLLVGVNGQLKIGDFGLARSTHVNVKNHTYHVITLWYRPPELLMRKSDYGCEIDMWSAGCIFGELLNSGPFFPGKDEIEQLDRIFAICGTPNAENWPEREALPDWGAWQGRAASQEQKPRILKQRFSHFDHKALDLLDKLLTLDPKTRISAAEALAHDYFYHPEALAPDKLPPLKFSSCHEFEAKQRIQQERERRAKEEAENKAKIERNRAAALPPPPPRSGGWGGPAGGGRGSGPISKESTGW